MKLQEIRNNRIGEIFYNNHGEFCEIIEYNDCENIKIKFNNGYIKMVSLSTLRNKSFNNPYTKTVFDKGYLGEGIYIPTYNEPFRTTLEYSHWNGIMKRCYSKNQLKLRPTYIGCSVDEKWHNFQIFAKWYCTNLWNQNCTIVDKDILNKGNKIYSSETCVLVNDEINNLFINAKRARGDLPIGVTLYKENRYKARCNVNNKRKEIGIFDTPELAFQAYKEFKESHIKQVANKYKDKYDNFPTKLYNAMYNWKIEITD